MAGSAVAQTSTSVDAAPAPATTAVAPAPAAPASPATITTSPAQSSDADLDRVVCRTSGPPTGSRLGGRRTCQTQREWNAQEQQNQDELNKAQIQRGLNQPGG